MCALGEVGGGEGCGWNQSLKGSLHHVSEHHTATPYLYCRQFSRDVNQFVSQGVVNMLSAAQWVAHPSGFHQHVIGMDAATLGWDGGGMDCSSTCYWKSSTTSEEGSRLSYIVGPNPTPASFLFFYFWEWG